MRSPNLCWTLLGLSALFLSYACGDGDSASKTSSVGGQGGTANQGGATAGAAGFASIENPCGAPDPSLGALDSAQLFSVASVPTFDLYLPADSWASLQVNARDEIYVPAQACFNGTAIGLVGLRFKGSYGSLFNCFNSAGENTCRKLGMKIKFDEYESSQRFYGLDKLNFHGYHYDDSYIKEPLAYDLYRSMGGVACQR
jgi:spore coat protein H